MDERIISLQESIIEIQRSEIARLEQTNSEYFWLLMIMACIYYAPLVYRMLRLLKQKVKSIA